MIYTILFLLLSILFMLSILVLYNKIYTNEKFNVEKDDNFNKTSFFEFDKIERDENKRIVAINEKTKYIFSVTSFNTIKPVNFPMNTLPYIVYYKDDSSKELFLILCKITNMDTTGVIFEKQIEDFAFQKQAVLYVSLLHQDDFNKFKKRQGVKFYNYSKIETRQLYTLLPYAHFTHEDISYSKEVFKFIKFDECIYQNNKKYVAHKYDTSELVKNFYNMLGYKILENKKVRFSEEITVQTYIKDRVTFTASHNIKGKITRMIKNDYIEFLIKDDIDEKLNARVKIGDVIILKNQTFDIENNKYFFIGDNKLVTAFPLTVDIENKDKDVIEYRSKDIYYINLFDRVYFTNIEKSCIVMKKTLESDMFIILCKPIKEDVEEFLDYECVTNRNIKFKDQCESPYEISGKMKNGFDIWDKRCRFHTDCPFFNLQNYKGQCNNNGYCEMPLGVTNIGYRKYSTGSQSSECPYKDESGGCIF